jgi:hypothetical protein
MESGFISSRLLSPRMSTTTTAPVGSFAVTSHATGRNSLFYSDGSKWQTVGAGSGGDSKQTYRARLFQSGTNAPTEGDVLENTLSDSEAWEYSGPGLYKKSIGTIDLRAKTWVIMGSPTPVNVLVLGLTTVNWDSEASETYILLETKKATAAGNATGIDADGLLSDTPIEIIIYP